MKAHAIVLPLAYSGAQDFVLALLPWTVIWGLQMKKKEKFGIALAMSMGILYATPQSTSRRYVERQLTM